ncbi:MAG TPA: hypothetical protein VIT23_18850 [Terrimicrobiaceae bacterium]
MLEIDAGEIAFKAFPVVLLLGEIRTGARIIGAKCLSNDPSGQPASDISLYSSDFFGTAASLPSSGVIRKTESDIVSTWLISPDTYPG